MPDSVLSVLLSPSMKKHVFMHYYLLLWDKEHGQHILWSMDFSADMVGACEVKRTAIA